MNRKEQNRSIVLNKVLSGQLICKEAATILGISLRQFRRILAKYKHDGSAALAHGNRGKKAHNALDSSIKNKVVELARTTYAGCNHQYFTELLAERESIELSRASVRSILLEAGIRSPKRRRAPKHRNRRDRWPQEGMLLQTDGSQADWLEGRGPRLTLIGAIDDATGIVPAGVFRYQEDAQGYMLLFKQIVTKDGVPEAAYHDAHGIFERSSKEPETIEEQLAGKRTPTQFGRVLEELGIISITSRSPQARGRIERLWGTFQSRLTIELRLAGSNNIHDANRVLQTFLPKFNRRFAVPPAEEGIAYRQLPADFDPDRIFCFKYSRVVGLDNVVTFGQHRLQILPSNGRLSYARTQVEVHERLDGSILVYFQGQCLATIPAPPTAPVLRARGLPRVKAEKIILSNPEQQSSVPAASILKQTKYKPATDHPWRRISILHRDRG